MRRDNYSLRSPKREQDRLRARLEKHDLQRALAHFAVLPHELVQATFSEQPAPVLADFDTV